MRIDLDRIQAYVAPNSHVLDLACGNGDLLWQLKQTKNISGIGLEYDAQNILACINKGISVIEYDLNNGLTHIADNSYDVVIMTLTLQIMKRPDLVLDEMLRIGKQCIITFPNFAHWKARWHLFFHGRMPVSDLLPYEWYDTPNIHFCTVKDFEALCANRQISILDNDVVNEKGSSHILTRRCPNLFGETAVYHLSKSI